MGFHDGGLNPRRLRVLWRSFRILAFKGHSTKGISARQCHHHFLISHPFFRQVQAALQNFSAGIIIAALGGEIFPLLVSKIEEAGSSEAQMEGVAGKCHRHRILLNSSSFKKI